MENISITSNNRETRMDAHFFNITVRMHFNESLCCIIVICGKNCPSMISHRISLTISIITSMHTFSWITASLITERQHFSSANPANNCNNYNNTTMTLILHKKKRKKNVAPH